MSASRPLWFVLALLSSACASSAPPGTDEAIALDAPAAKLEGKRYLEVRVGVRIAAPPPVVWDLLVDGPAYPSWNSTVIALDGTIAEGEIIELKSTVDPERSFELEVSGVEAARTMVWADGGRAFRGERRFRLEPLADGGTAFTMREVMTGTMMGMIAPRLPDFRPTFDGFATDLKAAAEQRAGVR